MKDKTKWKSESLLCSTMYESCLRVIRTTSKMFGLAAIVLQASATEIETLPNIELFLQDRPQPVMGENYSQLQQLEPVLKLLADKKYEQAISLLQPLQKNNENDISMCYLLSIAYVGQAEWAKADKVSQQCVAIDNKWMTIHNLRGTILAALGKNTEALNQYNYAISISPNDPSIYLQRAYFYYRNTEHEDNALFMVLKDTKTYLKLGGPQESVDALQGFVYSRLNNKSLAIKHLASAIKTQPTNMTILAKLLTLYYEDDQVSLAKNLLLQSGEHIDLEDDKYKSKFNHLQAKHAIIVGEESEVERYFRAALKHEPSNSQVRKEFIYWLDKQERLQETVLLAKQGLTYSANDSYFISYLAWAIADEGIELEEAQRWLNKARKLEPNNVYLSDTQAWINVREGNYRQAIETIQASINYAEQVPEIAYHAGVIWYHLGNKKKSVDYLLMALKSNESFNGKTQAQILLERIRAEIESS